MRSKKVSKFDLIRSCLKEQKLEAAIIDHPLDLLYLTGLTLSAGRLILSQEKVCLFVDGRYLQAAQENSPVPSALLSRQAVADCTASFKTVGFDAAHTTYDQFLKLSELLGGKLKPLSLKSLRAIKDASEIKAMKKSAALLWKGFLHIKKRLRAGVSEEELARDFEIFCLKNGGEGVAFEPIIAFGENSALPHHRAGKTKLKKNQLVLIDIGVVVDTYHSDMTRTICFGKINPQLKILEKLVRDAHAAALKLCKPGVKIGKLDEAARKVFSNAGVEDLFVHSLGHGIGLETHEFPRIKYDGDDKDALLQPGMVITIEPGLYKPKLGGIRYEDTIVITAEGYQNFYDR